MLNIDEETMIEALRVVEEAIDRGFEACNDVLKVKKVLNYDDTTKIIVSYTRSASTDNPDILGMASVVSNAYLVVIQPEHINGTFITALADIVAQAVTFNRVMDNSASKKQEDSARAMSSAAEELRKVLPPTKKELAKKTKELTFSEALTGRVLCSVVNTGDEVIFTAEEGEVLKLYHDKDCCESVTVEDVCGDLADLCFAPLVQAEEVSGADGEDKGDESYTWTFYKLRTRMGEVTIRWYGESNGYYSERVDFMQVK